MSTKRAAESEEEPLNDVDELDFDPDAELTEVLLKEAEQKKRTVTMVQQAFRMDNGR